MIALGMAVLPALGRELCKIRVPPQGFSGKVEMRSHCPRWDSKVLRNLAMPPTLQIVKEHDLSLDLRKSPEGSSEPFLKFCVLRRRFGRPATGRGRLG